MSALRKLAVAAAVLASVHSAEAMTYTSHLYKGHLAIIATGTFKKGDAMSFALFLDTLPEDLVSKKGNFVFFNSSGGEVEEAYTLGAAIELHHFMTGVEGKCESACVLAWAAGDRRYTVEGECIGVHNAAALGIAKKSKAAAGKAATMDMAAWLRERGAPPSVIAKMFATSASQITCLTDDDLTAWNVRIMP
jgi:hypothetical protein